MAGSLARSEVAILVPVLGRPHRVEPLIADVAASMSTPYRLLFIVDRADRPERRALEAANADHLVVSPGRRRYGCKINDGARATTEPLLFTGADDLHFHLGWFETAAAALRDGIDVVGTNDLTNPRVIRGKHSTHSLVRRSYVETFGTIDEPGLVLHEGYPHEYVDDEFVETARARRRFVACRSSVVEHLHPYRDLAPVDDTYRIGWRGRARGKALYERRRRLWTST